MLRNNNVVRVVVLTMALVLVATMGLALGAPKKLRFAVLLPTLDQPHFVLQKYGYEDEAAKLGIDLMVMDAGGYANIQKQINQIQDAVQAKVDAIILVSVSTTATIPAVEEAVAAGIPVINVNVMCDSDAIVARIRSDDTEIGKMLADHIAQKLNGKGNVLMLAGKAGASVIMMRANGFKERMKAYPGIKILAERYSEMTRAEGMRLMEDALQTYPKIDAVYTVGEHLCMGAVQALEAAKRTDIVVVGVDFSPDLERAIREGKVSATVTQQTILMGRLGIRTAKDVVEGKSVPKLTFCPIILVTKDNIDTVDRTGFEIPK